jgi:hypothetical protein
MSAQLDPPVMTANRTERTGSLLLGGVFAAIKSTDDNSNSFYADPAAIVRDTFAAAMVVAAAATTEHITASAAATSQEEEPESQREVPLMSRPLMFVRSQAQA